MKQKIYLLFTALLMMATTSAWADTNYDFIEDDIAYKINPDRTSVTVTYGTSDLPWNLQKNDFYSGDITIPATVEYGGTTYDVTEIGREAFRFAKITSITFKEGCKVTTIGKAAFNRCSELTQITIPSSVTTIAGDGVFGYCAKLTKINIGSGVTSIGDNFMYGSPVSSMYVYTSSVPSTSTYSFSNSSPTIHVYPALADDFKATSPWKDAGTIVGDIGTGSTYRDTTRVKIGELYYNLSSAGTATVTYQTDTRPWFLHVDNNSYKNPYTGDITIPKTVTFDGDTYDVTAIGQEAFRYATITSITFSEDSVTYIGEAAFNNCDELTEITIPNSVTKIDGDGAIAYCDKLKKITIGSGVTSIGDQFTYGSPIDTIYIYTTSVPSGPSNMFSGNRPNRIIHVYYDMVDAFKSATNWSNFSTYVGDLYDDVVSNLVLTDGTSFSAVNSFKAENATYTRTMSDTWGTIVLPFSAKSDDVKFYTVQKVDNGNLVVEEAITLTAGTPAIIKKISKSDDDIITCTATDPTETITTTINETSTEDGNYKLVGSYTQDQLIDNKNAYYIYGDTFYKNGSSFFADAFRAYLLPISSSSTNSTSFSIVVDDDPTGINNAIGADNAAEIEGVYSVSGVKQADLQKGINIIRYRSGKTQKVILK